MDIDYETLFETTIQMFLGKSGSYIGILVRNEKSRKNWYRKVLRKVAKRIQSIETSTIHKVQLESCNSQLLEILKNSRSFNEQEFSLYLLRFIALLLGFLKMRGYFLTTPAYFQTANQFYNLIDGDELQEQLNDKQSATSVRAGLISQLKSEGHNDFFIALVLNISEYEVKKLRFELEP